MSEYEEYDDETVSLDDALSMVTKAEKSAKAKRQESARKGKNTRYENQLKELPLRASPEAEIRWIRNHSAMGRKTRTGEDVLLTEGDIKDAPSRSAASQLQNWANRPDEFYKQLFQLQRTKIKDGAGESEEEIGESPEVARIDEMLALLDCAVVDD